MGYVKNMKTGSVLITVILVFLVPLTALTLYMVLGTLKNQVVKYESYMDTKRLLVNAVNWGAAVLSALDVTTIFDELPDLPEGVDIGDENVGKIYCAHTPEDFEALGGNFLDVPANQELNVLFIFNESNVPVRILAFLRKQDTTISDQVFVNITYRESAAEFLKRAHFTDSDYTYNDGQTSVSITSNYQTSHGIIDVGISLLKSLFGQEQEENIAFSKMGVAGTFYANGIEVITTIKPEFLGIGDGAEITAGGEKLEKLKLKWVFIFPHLYWTSMDESEILNNSSINQSPETVAGWLGESETLPLDDAELVDELKQTFEREGITFDLNDPDGYFELEQSGSSFVIKEYDSTGVLVASTSVQLDRYESLKLLFNGDLHITSSLTIDRSVSIMADGTIRISDDILYADYQIESENDLAGASSALSESDDIFTLIGTKSIIADTPLFDDTLNLMGCYYALGGTLYSTNWFTHFEDVNLFGQVVEKMTLEHADVDVESDDPLIQFLVDIGVYEELLGEILDTDFERNYYGDDRVYSFYAGEDVVTPIPKWYGSYTPGQPVEITSLSWR